MRTLQNRARRAFTLIEILIVVVILGILAAIVIPQFTDASDQANVASMKSQLQTMRSQIELFRIQDVVAYNLWDPILAAPGTEWDPLISGDYLQSAPRNPITNASTVAAAPAVIVDVNETRRDAPGDLHLRGPGRNFDSLAGTGGENAVILDQNDTVRHQVGGVEGLCSEGSDGHDAAPPMRLVDSGGPVQRLSL